MNRRKWISNSLLFGASAISNPYDVFAHTASTAEKPGSPIKLSSNENPYGPSKKALLAIEENLLKGNRYPNEARVQLTDTIATKFNLSRKSVLLGAGSSDILQLLACWCIREKHTVTTSKLTFDILPKYIKRFGGHLYQTELTPEKGLDLNAIEAISNKNPGVVYLVNPNNPTGSKVAYNDLLDFCERISQHSYVVVDEAYIEYVVNDESVAHLIQNNPKIIVVRTFSKIYGLAGLRIGYALAHAETADTLRNYQVWAGSNLNNLGIAAATASLADTTFVTESRSKNLENRAHTLNALRKLGRFCVEPHANFIWFRCNPFEGNLGKIYARNNIIVGAGEVDGGTWMRVTIGKKETMQRFVEVAKSIWI